MKSKFSKLFSAPSTVNEHAALKKGESFPQHFDFGTVPSKTVVCFISLTCYNCINMLPQLKEIEAKCNEHLKLIILGSQEEVTDIKQHFNFNFEVFSADEELFYETYRVQQTPFIYEIDSNMIVQRSKTITDIQDLKI